MTSGHQVVMIQTEWKESMTKETQQNASAAKNSNNDLTGKDI